METSAKWFLAIAGLLLFLPEHEKSQRISGLRKTRSRKLFYISNGKVIPRSEIDTAKRMTRAGYGKVYAVWAYNANEARDYIQQGKAEILSGLDEDYNGLGDSGIFYSKKPPISDKPISAVRLTNGYIYYDDSAKIHLDLINNLGINPEDVADGGFIVNGKYVEGSAGSRGIGIQARAKKAIQNKRAMRSQMMMFGGLSYTPVNESWYNLPSLKLKKQSNGKYKAFFIGTNNPYEIGNYVADIDEFESLSQARAILKAYVLKSLQKQEKGQMTLFGKIRFPQRRLRYG